MRLTNDSSVILLGTSNFTERYSRDAKGWLKISARGPSIVSSAKNRSAVFTSACSVSWHSKANPWIPDCNDCNEELSPGELRCRIKRHMPLSFAELEGFYRSLVTRARDQGIACAITSGMACVTFGVATTTKDCDLLCAPDAARKFFDLLCGASLAGQFPKYRGHLTAPLDERWLRGGWTSHFVWDAGDAEAYLDVFGFPPRASSPWQKELDGFYVSRHTVAEMKRTNRERDWPYVTALGAQMIEAGDERGWLHVFDENLLLRLMRTAVPPSEIVNRRPILGLAMKADPRVRAALHAEVQFWHELDRVRMRIYQKAVRPYMQAVKRARLAAGAALPLQHELRLRCAEGQLPFNPLVDFGVDRMIEEARSGVAELVNPAALPWLPDVREHFKLPK